MQLMAKAAGGDIRSLREMASRSHEAAFGRRDLTGVICLSEALTFSRLATAAGCQKSNGNTAAILLEMASMLCAMGEDAQGQAFAKQARELTAREEKL